MRRAGRRIPWKTLIDELGLVGTIRTHSSTYGDQEPYNVAVLNASDSPIAKEMELFEPELVMLGDQALILRGSDAVVPEDWATFAYCPNCVEILYSRHGPSSLSPCVRRC